MARDRKILYSFSVAIFAILLAVLLLPVSGSRTYAAILLPLAAVAALVFIKKRSIHSIFKKQVFMILTVSALLYVVIYYLAGLKFGFNRSLAIGWITLFKYILPTISIIVSTEIIRGVLVAQGSRFADVFCFLFAVTAEIIALGDVDGISTFNLLVDFVGLTVLPAVTGNLFYNYISKRYGMYSIMSYRLITALFIYIFKYVPAVPGALYSFARLLIPLILYAFINALYEKKVRYAIKRVGKLTYVGVALALAFMVCVVMLISCQFRFGMLVIGSESMSGELEKGDAIVYESYDGEILEVGQVVVFRQGKSQIIHRIVDVQKINSRIIYYTKGDANDNIDVDYITSSDIVGVCRVKIPYLGYPSIWLRKIVKFR